MYACKYECVYDSIYVHIAMLMFIWMAVCLFGILQVEVDFLMSVLEGGIKDEVNSS